MLCWSQSPSDRRWEWGIVGKDLWEMFTENNSNDRIFFHVDAILILTNMVDES